MEGEIAVIPCFFPDYQGISTRRAVRIRLRRPHHSLWISGILGEGLETRASARVFCALGGTRERHELPFSLRIRQTYPAAISVVPTGGSSAASAGTGQLGCPRPSACSWDAPEKRELDSSREANDGQLGRLAPFYNRLNDPG